MPEKDPNFLAQAGALIGGVLMGILGARKIPAAKRKQEQAAMIEVSGKTGGAKRISEESLGKITALKNELKKEYLPIRLHQEICRANMAEVMTDVVRELRASEARILTAIKRNGGSSGGG